MHKRHARVELHFNLITIPSSKPYYNKSFGQWKFLPIPQIRTDLTPISLIGALYLPRCIHSILLCLRNHLRIFLMCLLLMNHYVVYCPFSFV